VDDSCLRQEWRICTLDAVVPRDGVDAITIAAKWRWLRRRSSLAYLGSGGVAHVLGRGQRSRRTGNVGRSASRRWHGSHYDARR
jgi:hypothetical protein